MFSKFYNTFLFVHVAYIFPILPFASYSAHFVYKIATITLSLKKDKEFVARPITSMFLTLLGMPMKKKHLPPNRPARLICTGDVPPL